MTGFKNALTLPTILLRTISLQYFGFVVIIRFHYCCFLFEQRININF